jgi:hypothetical protein
MAEVFHPSLRRVKLIGSVHDELYLEAPEGPGQEYGY